MDGAWFSRLLRHPARKWSGFILTTLDKDGRPQADLLVVHCFFIYRSKGKVKEADLYSAFIEVPYTQGAQVRITQCYLQTTPYLPLPRKHSPDGSSQTEVADI